MRSILVATSGAPSADGAVRVGAELAARCEAALVALCVVEPQPVVDAGVGVPCIETPEAAEERRVALRASVEIQLERCGVSAPIRCGFGAAAVEIDAIARQVDAELIVLGLGSHRLIDRAFGGETALQLAQSGSVPVLAVASRVIHAPRRVVVAVDFSPICIRSARTVAGLMRSGDLMHLVHVMPAAHDPERTRDRQRVGELLAEEMDAVVSDLAPRDGVVVRTTIVEGDPASAILHIAERDDADLIVTGSRGYGFWKRLMIGSVASKILRSSRVSMLVTPVGAVVAPALGEREKAEHGQVDASHLPDTRADSPTPAAPSTSGA